MSATSPQRYSGQLTTDGRQRKTSVAIACITSPVHDSQLRQPVFPRDPIRVVLSKGLFESGALDHRLPVLWEHLKPSPRGSATLVPTLTLHHFHTNGVRRHQPSTRSAPSQCRYTPLPHPSSYRPPGISLLLQGTSPTSYRHTWPSGPGRTECTCT